MRRRSDLQAELSSMAGGSASAMSNSITFYPSSTFHGSPPSSGDENVGISKAFDGSAEASSSSQREFEVIEDSRKKRVGCSPFKTAKHYLKPRNLQNRRTSSLNQHICVQCGRTESPEWRRGPNGPKTLCNACGLRWAKTDRKDADPDQGPRRLAKFTM